jgi:hypothetical protein
MTGVIYQSLEVCENLNCHHRRKRCRNLDMFYHHVLQRENGDYKSYISLWDELYAAKTHIESQNVNIFKDRVFTAVIKLR